ncbi:hypothetical protein AAVH_21490 [Aphelenchoides avenae]|nr:hypothetical protein AAVH_21490 [Aphelenchus avenae]
MINTIVLGHAGMPDELTNTTSHSITCFETVHSFLLAMNWLKLIFAVLVLISLCLAQQDRGGHEPKSVESREADDADDEDIHQFLGRVSNAVHHLGLQVSCVKDYVTRWIHGEQISMATIFVQCRQAVTSPPSTTTVPTTTAKGFFEKVGGAIGDAAEDTVDTAKNVGEDIGDFVSDGAEKIKETAEDVWGNVTDPNSGPRKFVDDLWDKVSGFFGKAANKTAEAVGDAAETDTSDESDHERDDDDDANDDDEDEENESWGWYDWWAHKVQTRVFTITTVTTHERVPEARESQEKKTEEEDSEEASPEKVEDSRLLNQFGNMGLGSTFEQSGKEETPKPKPAEEVKEAKPDAHGGYINVVMPEAGASEHGWSPYNSAGSSAIAASALWIIAATFAFA